MACTTSKSNSKIMLIAFEDARERTTVYIAVSRVNGDIPITLSGKSNFI